MYFDGLYVVFMQINRSVVPGLVLGIWKHLELEMGNSRLIGTEENPTWPGGGNFQAGDGWGSGFT